MPDEKEGDPKVEAAVLLSLAVAKCLNAGLSNKVIQLVVRETLKKNEGPFRIRGV